MYQHIAWRAVLEHGAQHDVDELGMLLAVVHQVIRPRLMVEIGSWSGGSLWAWDQLGIPVIAVTLPEAAAEPFSAHGARMIWGDSHDEDTVAQLGAAIGGRTVDLVFIDGDHTAAGTAADLELAAAIAPGAAVAVHDINLHRRHPSVGVGEAWAAAAASCPHMVLETDPDTAPGVGILLPHPGELPAQFHGARAGITARALFVHGQNYRYRGGEMASGRNSGAGNGLYTVPLYAYGWVAVTTCDPLQVRGHIRHGVRVPPERLSPART